MRWTWPDILLFLFSGGLKAVMYTDTFQTVVMTLGSFALVGISKSSIIFNITSKLKITSKLPIYFFRSPCPAHFLLTEKSAAGFHKIGGYNNLKEKYMDAIPSIRNPNSTCGFPRSDAFNIFRDAVTGDNPWPGLLLQSSVGCLWYWCCDQVPVTVIEQKTQQR